MGRHDYGYLGGYAVHLPVRNDGWRPSRIHHRIHLLLGWVYLRRTLLGRTQQHLSNGWRTVPLGMRAGTKRRTQVLVVHDWREYTQAVRVPRDTRADRFLLYIGAPGRLPIRWEHMLIHFP